MVYYSSPNYLLLTTLMMHVFSPRKTFACSWPCPCKNLRLHCGGWCRWANQGETQNLTKQFTTITNTKTSSSLVATNCRLRVSVFERSTTRKVQLGIQECLFCIWNQTLLKKLSSTLNFTPNELKCWLDIVPRKLSFWKIFKGLSTAAQKQWIS